MATNLESSYHLCQLAHPLLKASGNSSVVFISSVAGLVHLFSGSIYGATKGKSLYSETFPTDELYEMDKSYYILIFYQEQSINLQEIWPVSGQKITFG